MKASNIRILGPEEAGPRDGPLLVIRNPIAGRRKARRFHATMDALAGLGARVEIAETDKRGDAEAWARSADAHYAGVVAAGGDGTINEVIAGLMARPRGPLTLGIVPMGTANVLAHELGLPMAPAAIARVLAEAPVGRVHLGLAGDRPFAMMAGVGFDADVVAAVNPRVKRALGKGAYVLESLRQWWALPDRTFTATIDGVAHQASAVIIANGHYYGGRYIVCPNASLANNTLEVALFGGQGRWNAARYLVGLGTGRLSRFADVTILPARSVTIEAPSPHVVQGDGDILGHTPTVITLAGVTLPVFGGPAPAAAIEAQASA